MMADKNNVPVIDINSWVDVSKKSVEERMEAAKEWHLAMKEFGCVIVVGHGLEEDVFSSLNDESRSFFAKPLSEKLSYCHGVYGHPSGGYCPPGMEIVALSNEQQLQSEDKIDTVPKEGNKTAKFDPVETFVFTTNPKRYVSPILNPCPITSASLYYEQMERVLTAVHSLSCAALGLTDINYFQQFYDASIPGNESKGSCGNALKLAHYPPLNASALQGVQEDHTGKNFHASVRYGAHTDYQGFTILRPDKHDWHHMDVHLDGSGTNSHVKIRAGGLEVFHRGSRKWMQVKIPKHLNALVINAGDFIQRWTNDIWHSPMHRVVTAAIAEDTHDCENEGISCSSPDSNGHPAGLYSRQAIVFFSGPLEDSVIECIDPTLMRPEVVGETVVRKYAPIRSGDHLLLKLRRTNGSEEK